MSFFLLLILLISFFYVLSRLNSLERKIDEVIKGKAVLPNLEAPQIKSEAPRVSQVMSSMEALPTSTFSPPALNLKEERSKDKGNTEFALGSKVLTGIGVVALLLGIGFFLRYAFKNDLISESLRVFLGIIFGIVVGATGHFLRKKYTSYGSALVGAGLGILYLSVYAAYSFYTLISMPLAFIALFIITALGVLGSLLYNSKPLVSYSFVGAFLIPLILPLSLSVHVLFVYLLIINAGVLLVARFKIWPELTIGSLVATSLIYLKWMIGPYDESFFSITIFYSTILFLIYFLTSLLNFVFRDRDYKGIDGFLLYSIPIAYFLLNLTIITLKDTIALFAFFIGIFYIATSFAIRAGLSKVGQLRTFSNAMLTISAPFIALATALHFEGDTLTIVWAIEALIMVLIGEMLKTASNRIAGLVLGILTGVRMIFFNLGEPLNSAPIFNTRGATMIVVGAMFICFLWIYHKIQMDDVSVDEKVTGRYIGAIGMFLTLFLWITLEARDFLENYYLYLPIIWMIWSGLMISLSFIIREKIIRFLSYGTVFLGFMMTLISLWDLDLKKYAPFFNIRVLTALIGAFLCAIILWLLKTNREQVSDGEVKIKNIFLVFANLLVLWAFTLEILGYYNIKISGTGESSVENTKRVVLSMFWLIYALSAMGIGILRQSVFARYFSIILFAVAIFKIFLYDTANLSDIYRFISFISLGIILLIAGFAYYKFKDRITQFVKVEETPKV